MADKSKPETLADIWMDCLAIKAENRIIYEKISEAEKYLAEKEKKARLVKKDDLRKDPR